MIYDNANHTRRNRHREDEYPPARRLGVDAARAAGLIDAANDEVAGARGKLGAIQNRLEHTIANLAIYQENLTASESRIRDTDMAKEMVKKTKLDILSQAGMSMLGQANQAAQGVTSLLR